MRLRKPQLSVKPLGNLFDSERRFIDRRRDILRVQLQFEHVFGDCRQREPQPLRPLLEIEPQVEVREQIADLGCEVDKLLSNEVVARGLC